MGRHSEKKECYVLLVVASRGQVSRLHSAVSFSGVAGRRTESDVFRGQERKRRLIWKLSRRQLVALRSAEGLEPAQYLHKQP